MIMIPHQVLLSRTVFEGMKKSICFANKLIADDMKRKKLAGDVSLRIKRVIGWPFSHMAASTHPISQSS